MSTILGHHHISMLMKDAQVNANFYRNVLGLRLVKKSVNQDDPSMYHLFYGDTKGSPGFDLTFFEMPYIGKTYRGTNAITRIGLLVKDANVLKYWKQRFEEMNVEHGEISSYAGRKALPFTDPDGLELILIDNEGAPIPSFWEPWKGSVVPVENQILGMGPVEITVRDPEKTANLLKNVFKYTEVSETNDGTIYQSVPGANYSEIIIKQRDGERERPGRGSVHHLAIRVENQEKLGQLLETLRAKNYHTTEIVDRYYFKAVYFRDRNGIMFELSTDEPGFDIDEPVDELGKKLALPPFLEHKRTEIETILKPID